MKRKFKLFATVASLCLCLALMAFGVYAATSVKYTASGSVTYTVSDVKADFTLTVNKGSTKGTKREAGTTTFTGVSFSEHKAASTKYSYDHESGSITNPGAAEALPLEDSIGELDFAVADVYQIVITVKNVSKSGKISVTSKIAKDFDGNANMDLVAAANYETAQEVAAGTVEPVTYTYYVYLLDPSETIASTQFALEVTATNV